VNEELEALKERVANLEDIVVAMMSMLYGTRMALIPINSEPEWLIRALAIRQSDKINQWYLQKMGCNTYAELAVKLKRETPGQWSGKVEP
jgi:hypothetical protein